MNIKRIALTFSYALLLATILTLSIPSDSQAADYGTLSVHTSPGSVKIYIDDEYSGQTDSAWGNATVQGILPGTYTLLLTKEGYGNWSKQVTIAANQQTTLYAYLEAGVESTTTRNESITQTASYGTLSVHTSPGSVKIYIDDEYSGQTDSAWGDAAVQGILPGTYTLLLTKEGYGNWSKQVTINIDLETEIYAYLEPGVTSTNTRNETITQAAGYGTLSVFASPGSVKIYINNEYSGQTSSGWGDATIQGILPGTYTLLLTKEGYGNWSKQVTINTELMTDIYAYLEPGVTSTTTRNETITQAAGYGVVNVHTSPGSVKIYINNEYSGQTDSAWGDAAVQGVLPGTYTLLLTKEGYGNWSKQVIIAADQQVTIYAYLEPGVASTTTRNESITQAASYGTLSVYTSPGSVKIYIDNEYSGQTNSAWGDATIQGILPGTYTLLLTKEGYGNWSKQVTINTDLETEIYAYLEPGMTNTATRNETITQSADYGTLNLHTDPGSVKIYINDEYSSQTDSAWGDAAVQGILPGTYTLLLIKEDYSNWSKQVTIDAGQDTEIWAYLEPGTSSPPSPESTPTPTSEPAPDAVPTDTETTPTTPPPITITPIDASTPIPTPPQPTATTPVSNEPSSSNANTENGKQQNAMPYLIGAIVLGLVFLGISVLAFRRRRRYDEGLEAYRQKLEQWEKEGYNIAEYKKRWFGDTSSASLLGILFLIIAIVLLGIGGWTGSTQQFPPWVTQDDGEEEVTEQTLPSSPTAEPESPTAEPESPAEPNPTPATKITPESEPIIEPESTPVMTSEPTTTPVESAEEETWDKALIGSGDSAMYTVAVGPGRNDNVNRVYGGTNVKDHGNCVSEYSYSSENWFNTNTQPDDYYGSVRSIAIGAGRYDMVQRVYAGFMWSGYGSAREFTYSGDDWSRGTLNWGTSGTYSVAPGPGRNDNVPRVYCARYYRNISEMDYSGGNWVETNMGEGTAVMRGVAVGAGRNDGHNRVYGANEDGHMYEFTYENEAWTQADIGSVPSPMIAVTVGDGRNDGVLRVYASNDDGHIYEFTYSSGKWTMASIGYGGSIMHNIDIGAGRSDGVQRVYGANEDGHVYEFSYVSGSWIKSDLGEGESIMRDVAVGEGRNDRTVRVYGANDDGYIYEFTY